MIVQMLSQDDIQRVFDCELLSLLPSLGLQDTDVAWPNATFEPSPDKGFLRVFLLPGAAQQATLGFPCFVRLNGLYQISICRPKGEGSAVSRAWKEAILSTFYVGRVLPIAEGLSITINNAYDGAMQEDEDRAITPITVSYFCYAPQNPSEPVRH